MMCESFFCKVNFCTTDSAPTPISLNQHVIINNNDNSTHFITTPINVHIITLNAY